MLIVVTYLTFFKFGGNITGFFRIGENFPKSPYLNSDAALIFPGEAGADGQQFLTIAYDPFLSNPNSIKALDVPIYRYRRILYPLLGHLLGLGRVSLIPYAMIAINILSIVAIVFFVGKYLRSVRDKTWKSLGVMCIPGMWLVLTFSTAGLLNNLLLVVSLYFYRVRKLLLASIFIALACLTRETSLVMWLSMFVASLYNNATRRSQSFFLLGALIPFAGWSLYLESRSDLHVELDVVGSNFGYPFQGILYKFISFFQESISSKELYEIYSFSLLIGVFCVLLAISLRNMRLQKELVLAAILYSSIFLFSKATAYYLGYNRIFIDVYILLLLVQPSKRSGFLNKIKLLIFGGATIGSLAFLVLSN